MSDSINIKNKKAYFNYEILETFTAGIVLTGAEVKSIRNGKSALTDSYCYITNKGEVWIKGVHISPYDPASYNNQPPLRDRKLLLNKGEISKLQKKLKDKGLTLVPIRMFLSNTGFIKVDFGLAKGKKMFDKREDLKQKDDKRSMDRAMKVRA